MLVGVVRRGKYGERLLETIRKHTDFQVVSVEVPEVLPDFIEDPEEFEEDAPDLHFDLEGAMEMYYSASTAATAGGQNRRIRQREFFVRELPEIGVTIGIDRNVRDRLQTRSLIVGEGELFHEPSPEPQPDGDFLVFADGLAIALDDRWAEDRMSRDPLVRRDA